MASTPEEPPSAAHVLVVDDDADSLALCAGHLRHNGFAVSTADTAHAGLAIAQSARPHAVLLDLGLPDMDGLDVLRALKAHTLTRAIPILLLTGRGDTESKVRGFDLGASDYLTKPVAEAELRARLSLHLRQQRLLEQLEQRLRHYRDHFGEIETTSQAQAPHHDLPRQEVARLFEARRLIMRRLADPPSLDELASAVGTNQPKLSKGFRTLFGTTVFG
jgi:DNA-binding response OmpR family regulator